ncbi:MAG TPA: tRNA uridine-5-carboxymethylaminomethyl(34) synthesis enzyme MnmG, partial [Verrucomicrobiae bacterium]|nr:tRNA uridine-5-carboxymethylaminomethyl(34) synthesis enzyme MnmG [Verrucomicrobiae bacterium]
LRSEADPAFLEEFGLEEIQNAFTWEQLLRRPEFTYQDLRRLDPAVDGIPAAVREQVEIQVKYRGYIERQLEQVEKSRSMEGTRIPDDMQYEDIPGLSRELREKLSRHRPDTLGQASRIQGMTPAAVGVLAMTIRMRGAR